MAMDAGTVNAAGAGSGMAKELFDDYSPKLNISAGAGSVAGLQQIADLCNSIAKVMVDHITTNAEVATTTSSTVTVTSVAGVTTGAGVSGAGAGTSEGTGTGGVT